MVTLDELIEHMVSTAICLQGRHMCSNEIGARRRAPKHHCWLRTWEALWVWFCSVALHIRHVIYSQGAQTPAWQKQGSENPRGEYMLSLHIPLERDRSHEASGPISKATPRNDVQLVRTWWAGMPRQPVKRHMCIAGPLCNSKYALIIFQTFNKYFSGSYLPKLKLVLIMRVALGIGTHIGCIINSDPDL